MYIAHRGYSHLAPENTIAAFQEAINNGATGIELDVHLTKDNKLVVIHDEALQRTTSGEGMVSEHELKQLKQFDAGSWFHPKYEDETIPTLSEVFEALPKDAFINVEIKNIPSFYKGIEKAVVETIERYGRFEDTVVSSFDHRCLYKVKQLNETIKIGLLVNQKLHNIQHYLRGFKPYEVYAIHPHKRLISAEDISEYKEIGLRTFVYTVNDEREANELLQSGVDGIISDCIMKKSSNS
ncbi:hypothetical protein DH09_03900 [Bacillaceae bacterium JMAK1]|nr:hypothetical protein DH09_03900 [Bacillaceae bacterium JMAK1]